MSSTTSNPATTIPRPVDSSGEIWHIAVGAICALAGYAGGPGAGSKNLTNIGLTNIKRTWNALTNKGVTAAATTLGKGLSYFAKNANYMAKPLVTAITKSSATVVSSSFQRDWQRWKGD